MLFAGCTQVGPDFIRPEPQIRQQWMQADEARVRTSTADYRKWWTAFQDPVLDNLVQIAYAQNIPLRVAGARVFEARARLGIAIGEQYPQVQQAVGAASYNRESERGAVSAAAVGRRRLRLQAGPGGRPPPAGKSISGASSGAPSSPRMRTSSGPSPPTTMPW